MMLYYMLHNVVVNRCKGISGVRYCLLTPYVGGPLVDADVGRHDLKKNSNCIYLD